MLRPTLHSRSLFVSVLLLGAAACEPELHDVEPGASPASGMVSVEGDTLVLAAPDHDQVLVVDASTREVQHRIDVGDEPSHVIVDGNRALATTRFGHTLEVIDTERGEVVRSITVGVEPVGLTKIDGARVAVVLAGESAVVVVNHETGAIEKRIGLASKDPRAIARTDDGRLHVTHMTAGVMSVIDVEAERAELRSMVTMNTMGPTTQPNLMRSITVAPDGNTLLVAHTQSNSSTVRAPIGEGFTDPNTGGGDCGYSGCATELPAQTPAVTEIEVTTGTVVTPEPAMLEGGDQNDGFGGAEPMPADCFDCGFGMPFMQNPPSFLNPNEMRFGGVPMNNATALALFDGGRGMLVLNTGSRNVVMLRRDLDGTAGDVLGVVNVGHGAQSLAISADGTRAFVYNQFDGTITEFELPVLRSGPTTTSKYIPADDGDAAPVAAEFREVAIIAGETWTVTDDALDPLVSRGRKLFHDALDTRISQSHSVSCATCHPDGRNDGQTWQFTFGPRNTPQLGGGILDTAPFHWPGDVTTHRDLNSLTVLAFMGGTGLDAGSLDAIGSFIDTIRAAPSPAALDTELSDAAFRGKEIFDSTEARCTECHTGDHFTDNKNWNIGTRAGELDRHDFQTPVLHGLLRSGPYLHDGSKATLEDLVRDVIRSDRMGRGSHLSDQEAADLVEYLKTL